MSISTYYFENNIFEKLRVALPYDILVKNWIRNEYQIGNYNLVALGFADEYDRSVYSNDTNRLCTDKPYKQHDKIHRSTREIVDQLSL